MSDETQTFRKGQENGDSRPFGISMRGWLALVIVATICLLSGLQIEVVEPLYSMGTMALGFYFGQKVNQNTK